jgi:hypothetical protein
MVRGWVALVLGAVFWPLVLMWAYAGGSGPESPTDSDTTTTTGN